VKRLVAVAALCAAIPVHAESGFFERLRQSIESHLGRPYVWGESGNKSFDCSGFVWRVGTDTGLFFKRTTARKLWFSTTPATAANRGKLGNLVFFDDLKHVGIVNDTRSFYHAQSSKGTNLSEMNAYWKPKVVGEHRFFIPPAK
jgi:cell wall-associated NlpC family hydrolase